jgi:riboflavin synthase
MFTGLVSGIGTVTRVTPGRGSTSLGIESPLPADTLRPGDSVAVDGVCLTVARRVGRRFFADVVAETLSRSTLGELRPGQRVNLEPSLRVGDPLGGHLVSGHVDGTARVVAVVRQGNDWRLRVALPPALRRYVAEKGSIALHGVSLTVARRAAAYFEVALIPQTRSRTTLGELRAGDRVHVEVDLLARYLETLTGFPKGDAPARARRKGRT